ncbi:copper resistance protein CopC [Cellulomonas sp. 179-A 9B4 NHS]|uniref:copper resistance CopC family protein n=1 Tax=Cellulomonas sp. 179-A 9B4 NHS TaxID=3142379 RepID=UPI0039A1ABDF
MPTSSRPASSRTPLAPVVALLAALATAVVTLVLAAVPAAAHNSLRSSDPADGAAVAGAPAQITLTFDQAALELGSEVVVTAEDGTVVSTGPVQLADVSVVQPLAEDRPAGAYRVDWRVTSADGHPISGTFGFTASEPVGAAAAGSTAAPAEGTMTTMATPTAEATTAEEDPTPSPSESVDLTPDMGGSGEAARDNYPGTLPWWAWVLMIVVVIGAVFTVVARKQRGGDAPDRGGVADGTPQDGGPRAG